jgi:hypothetical protein
MKMRIQHFGQNSPKYELENTQPLQQMGLGKLDIYLQKTGTISQILPCTRISLKWTNDLIVKSETVKLLQEKIGYTLDHKGIGSKFVNKLQ